MPQQKPELGEQNRQNTWLEPDHESFRMSRRLARYSLILIILVVALLLSFAMVKLKPEPPKKEADTRAMLVDVLEMQPQATRFRVHSQGTVKPRTETILSAEVSGTVVSVASNFIPGGVFGKGDTLLRIDPARYEVAVERSEALVRQRQIEYDGALKLQSQGYRAEAELAAAATALASARAELVDARKNLERSAIRLPYAGMVRAKEADIGQFVSPGSRLGTVFAIDFAEVRLPLTDRDLAFVELPPVGSAVTSENSGPEVTLTAVQGGVARDWQARIVRSEGIVDESSRVTYVVARVDDPYQLEGSGVALPMGTFVSAEIAGRQVEGLFQVPRHALRGSDELLFVDEDDKIRIGHVEVIRSDAAIAYVRHGVSAGDRVVLTSIESPFNGMPVRTSESIAAPGAVASGAETPPAAEDD